MIWPKRMAQRAKIPALLATAGAAILLGGVVIQSVFAAPQRITDAATTTSTSAGKYTVLAWNDLGMHCYNRDFQDLAVLPPYNNLWAQVVKVGDPPQVVTSGVSVEYYFADNSYSAGKSNFWDYAKQLFGVDLPPDVGLKGKGLSGTMDVDGDHFVAEGIPLTEFSDSAPTTPDPYQLATVIVRDTASGAELARSTVVAPVSTEMHCDNCHKDGGVDGIATGRVETNILTLHDQKFQSEYPAGHTGALMDRKPVLCAECHSSNALHEAGVAGVPSLSNAMHTTHKDKVTPDINGCYNCHPGPNTQCLRDVMSSQEGMTCIDCHGTLDQVSQNPNPWLNEPRCDAPACHGNEVHQDNALYRLSKGHGQIYCEACHDSPHAIAPSSQPRDAIKFIDLQGHGGPIDTCTVCHSTQPSGDFSHSSQSSTVTPTPSATTVPVATATAETSATSTPRATPTATSTPTATRHRERDNSREAETMR